MSSWMSDNSKKHYGFPNKDEISELIGRVCCGVFVALIIIFIVLML